MYYCVKILNMNEVNKEDLQNMLTTLNSFCGNINQLIIKERRTKAIKDDLVKQLDQLNDYIRSNNILLNLHRGEIDMMSIPTNSSEFIISEYNLSFDLRDGLIPKLENLLDNL